MNRHFDDARYYLKRAGEHAKRGVTETLAPVVARGRKVVGEEDDEPEPGRAGRLRSRLHTARKRVENEVGELVADGRRRVRRYRRA